MENPSIYERVIQKFSTAVTAEETELMFYFYDNINVMLNKTQGLMSFISCFMTDSTAFAICAIINFSLILRELCRNKSCSSS